MTRQENRRLLEGFAIERDTSVLAEGFVLRDQAQERSFQGREAIAAFLNAVFVEGFTGTEAEVQAMVIDEEEVALAFIFRGRQSGPFMGIPPTGQMVEVPMVLLCRIEEGQIKAAPLYYDAGTLLRQLGLGLYTGQ